jgi:hypothetical protein
VGALAMCLQIGLAHTFFKIKILKSDAVSIVSKFTPFVSIIFSSIKPNLMKVLIYFSVGR